MLGPPAATATQPPAAPAEPTTDELRRENDWKCTVYYLEVEERPGVGRVSTPRVQLVYLDQTTLVRAAATP